eukprot:TRINITY_DN105381_c0_g1_i1.p1 TRINITY_DN105381_c0_g1~~TRINITY_DN105381_c0_g1_i1.p1  ORF type:complete len:1062 (-),score=195.90 TRINITY_DN105381_c0_g1_i1:13-3198(-)
MLANSPPTELDDEQIEPERVQEAAAGPLPAGSQGHAEECSICNEVVSEGAEAMHCLGSGGMRHRFHGRCLTRWVESCRNRATLPSCPNCRGPVEIHTARLASQIGAAGSGADSVQEFLALHASQAEGDEVSEGWVRVGEQQTSVLESLKRRFEALDLALMSQRQLSSSSWTGIAPESEATATSTTTMTLAEVQVPQVPQVSHALVAPLQRSSHFSQSGAEQEDPIEDVSDEVLDALSAPPWPRRSPCELNRTAARQQVTVGDVQVHFPFDEVLQPQEEVIRNTVEAALRGKHVLIESPTGTGKTMALLCASLAAQRHMVLTQGTAPRIIFCTRTHHQIRQVVREARRSPYRPWLQIVGSREQGLCVEPTVLQAARADDAMSSQVCRAARRLAERRRDRAPDNVIGSDGRRRSEESEFQPRCHAWTSLADSSVVGAAHRQLRGARNNQGDPNNEQGMLDVEDLAELGQNLGACPYFLSRVALAGAELVICPYNYVLEQSIASATGLLEDRSVIIVDEGHNLENQCCEVGSFCVSGTTLQEIARRVEEAERYLLDFHSGDQRIDFERFSRLKDIVVDIYQVCLDTVNASVSLSSSQLHQDRCDCRTWNSTLEAPPNVTDFFERTQWQPWFASAVEALQETLKRRGEGGGSRLDGLANQVLKALVDLESLAKAMERCNDKPTQFKIHLEAVRENREARASQAESQSQALSRWSFELSILLVHPEAIFQNIAEAAHSVIIASGTLAPTASFSAELGTAFAERLLRQAVEAPHIIAPSQLGVAFVGKSRRGIDLRCVKEKMVGPFFTELGRTMVEITAAIPGGILVFFPSRRVLDDAVSAWQMPQVEGRPSLWELLQEKKGSVAVEGGPDAAHALRAHEDTVAREGSAVLFCVYRGRSSEGVSLSDAAVRGVICVGIPLPPLNPAVRLKRRYNDAVVRARRADLAQVSLPRRSNLDGESWYHLGAHRAVNQALGRAVRHRQDYGAVVLLDERWTGQGSLRAVRYLPRWLKQLVGIHEHMRGEDLAFPIDRLLQNLQQHFASQGSAQGGAAAETSDRSVRPRLDGSV